MMLDLRHSKFLKVMGICMPVISALSPTIKLQIVLFLFPYISCRGSGERIST